MYLSWLYKTQANLNTVLNYMNSDLILTKVKKTNKLILPESLIVAEQNTLDSENVLITGPSAGGISESLIRRLCFDSSDLHFKKHLDTLNYLSCYWKVLIQGWPIVSFRQQFKFNMYFFQEP